MRSIFETILGYGLEFLINSKLISYFDEQLFQILSFSLTQLEILQLQYNEIQTIGKRFPCYIASIITSLPRFNSGVSNPVTITSSRLQSIISHSSRWSIKISSTENSRPLRLSNRKSRCKQIKPKNLFSQIRFLSLVHPRTSVPNRISCLSLFFANSPKSIP